MKIVLVCASVLAALLISCNRKEEPKQKTQPAATILGPEDVVRASVGQVLTGPVVSGELEARERATIRAQLAGSVIEVNARAGQRVRQGEVLIRIRAIAEREAVASAQAAVRTAQTELTAAERDVDRTAVLVKAGALAERDLEQAQTAAAAASARVAEAEARLAAAREQLRESVLRAPINGVITARTVDTGDVLSAGAELLTIVDPSTLELRASVPAEDLSAIRIGTAVLFSVQGYQDRTFRGNITRIVPAADPATRQVDVYASLPNNSGILAVGLYVQGRIATGDEKAIMIPSDALQNRGNADYVLKISDGKIAMQQVSVGARDERTGRLQITSGLKEGDMVLIGSARDLRPGAPVELRGNPTASR